MLFHAIGAGAGRGTTAGVGLTLLGVILEAMMFRRQSGREIEASLDPRSRTSLAAGATSAAIVLTTLTYARAGIAADLMSFNRSLQNIAIPVTLAVAPIVAVAGRAVVRRAWPVSTPAAATGVGLLSPPAPGPVDPAVFARMCR